MVFIIRRMTFDTQDLYKYLTTFLVAMVLAGLAFHFYQRHTWQQKRKGLNQALSQSQKTQRETQSAYSRLALEASDLSADKEDLQEIIEDRDERIVAITKARLKIKPKTFLIEKSTQTEVVSTNTDNKRTKVEFSKEKEGLKVRGFTLTNPPFAEVTVEWVKDLNLEIILAKDDSGQFRAYLDSASKDIVPAEISLQVDPSVLDFKWYQNISFGTQVNVGPTGGILGLSAHYDITPQWAVGPTFQILIGGVIPQTFYGAGVAWHPWR